MSADKLYTSLSANINGPDLQHHRLTNIVHLTLKMTPAQVIATSVTNSSF